VIKTTCAVCGTLLIEGGEHDSDNVGEIIVNLSCPKCNSQVIYI
jgi:RNase P subunit RPR2